MMESRVLLLFGCDFRAMDGAEDIDMDAEGTRPG